MGQKTAEARGSWGTVTSLDGFALKDSTRGPTVTLEVFTARQLLWTFPKLPARFDTRAEGGERLTRQPFSPELTPMVKTEL